MTAMPWPSSRVAHQEHATKICADPTLPLRVRFVDAKTPAAEVAAAVEGGMIAIHDGFRAPLDLEFLRAMPVWPDTNRRIKKAKLRDFEAPLPATDKGFAGHLLGELFPGDRKRALYLQEQVRVMVEFMRDRVRALFPGYRFNGDEGHSWRLVESFPEGLHCDTYTGHDDDTVRLRLFYNYDVVPRVWTTTYDATELAEMFWGDWGGDAHGDDHPNAINFLMNEKIPWHALPRHHIFFAPGTLWMADTQLVSHEIFYGRRGCAFTFGADAASMTTPTNGFQPRMRAAVRRMRDAK